MSGPSVIFNHPAARLVKTIPPLNPPSRINGHVPLDNLGGSLSPTHVILSDTFGPLSISAVPDPFNPRIFTIVLSVGFDSSQLGAARRFVLPFRSFEVDSTGKPLTKSKVLGFNSAVRDIYQGLGAGIQGLDGGSFWFSEDVGEEGALDRQRWERDKVGRRGIWTVWLLSTPAPVVSYARDLLMLYPLPVPPLPPMFRGRQGFPWKDTFIALPAVPLQPATVQKRSLPPVPPHKPENLRSASIRRNTGDSTVAVRVEEQEPVVSQVALPASRSALLGNISMEHPIPHSPPEDELNHYDHLRSKTDEINATVGAVPSLSLPEEPAPLSHLKDASAVSATLRNLPSRASMPGYRNSLVAVDNETGQIISVLASDVRLDGTKSAASSEDGEEITTPVDEAPSFTGKQVTPKPSAILRPVSVYLDSDHGRLASRTESVLHDDTFAPPPLPPKPRKGGDASPSTRMSVTSAAFFSAAEDQEDTEDETRAAMLANFISIDGHQIESHRPDLLKDDNDDARSDASGSTIGRPVVKMWRKARGKEKRQGKATARPQKEASEASDRTSKAETAAEKFSDEEPEEGDPAEEEEEEEEEEDKAADLPGKFVTQKSSGHLARTQLRTEDVRTIEDGVWREALESGELPIDAPYTHLAARRLANLYGSDNKGQMQEFELCAPGESLALQPLAQRRDYMQGGTVLIEFLAGSSKIGASIIRSAGQDVVDDVRTGGVLSLVPVLPQHLLRFLGMTGDAPESGAFFSGITSLWEASAVWVGSFFTTTPKTEAGPERHDSEAEEWEYGIPEFDPNSLASTPRPVYRRKRPIPSARNGFNMPGGQPGEEAPSPKEAVKTETVKKDTQRYSVLHIDGFGVGRKTFLRGTPEYEGLRI